MKITGGSAVQGTDYTYTDQTVTFPAGSGDPVFVSVAVTNDGISEPDETIEFSLQNPTNGATFSSSVLTLNIIDDDGLGIPASHLAVLKAYPNPVENELNIRLSEHGAARTIRIVDSLGKIVWMKDISTNARTINVDTSSLSQGTYIVELGNAKTRLLKK